MAKETVTIFSVASLEPQTVTIDSDSNECTIPNGFGGQYPIVPTSLNDLNMPPNPFNVLATMAVIRADEEYSPQSSKPSIPSPISTPSMKVSTIEGWETTYTTTDDATFYSQNESRRVYWDISSSKTFISNESRHVSIPSSPSSTPPTSRQQKRKLSLEMSFPRKRKCRSTPPRHAATPDNKKSHPNAPENLKKLHTFNQAPTIIISLSKFFSTVVHIYGYVSNFYSRQYTHIMVRNHTEPKQIGTQTEPSRNKQGIKKHC